MKNYKKKCKDKTKTMRKKFIVLFFNAREFTSQ